MEYTEFAQSFDNEDDYNRAVTHFEFMRFTFKCFWNYFERNGSITVLVRNKGLKRWLRRNGQTLASVGFKRFQGE